MNIYARLLCVVFHGFRKKKNAPKVMDKKTNEHNETEAEFVQSIGYYAESV